MYPSEQSDRLLPSMMALLIYEIQKKDNVSEMATILYRFLHFCYSSIWPHSHKDWWQNS